MTIPFDNSFSRLPHRFYDKQNPTPVKDPKLIALNDDLARTLGIDPSDLTVDVLAGNSIPDGASPLAMAYAGHQFANFVPQLGDGRAVLLGEVIGEDANRYDLQLKGSGPTMFSRNGDGRSALGPVIREYLVSEAMFALGVPTTRALGAVTTGETVQRERGLPGAILLRVAKSHIRVGTFEFHYARNDRNALEALLEYTIDRHYPDLKDAENPALAFLAAVQKRQAALIAQWMQLGFIHGVMNTDNCAISGETIDFGPCAFMDDYHPGRVFSSIDQRGRYAWARQPQIANWNMSRLAHTLIPLIHDVPEEAAALAQGILDQFAEIFTPLYYGGFCKKLGIADIKTGDDDLINKLLNMMAETGADFTKTFRQLTRSLKDNVDLGSLTDHQDFSAWQTNWHARTSDESYGLMQSHNPVFIPRNHRVEQAIQSAEKGGFSMFNTLHNILSKPFEDQPEFAEYEHPPREEEKIVATFCGT